MGVFWVVGWFGVFLFFKKLTKAFWNIKVFPLKHNLEMRAIDQCGVSVHIETLCEFVISVYFVSCFSMRVSDI